MNSKKVVSIIVIFLIIFFLIFLGGFVYKKINKGNNISKLTSEELVEYILNIENYKAQVSVEVVSNKNVNKYKLQQSYKKDDGIKQVVIEPSTIEGTETTYKDGTLKVTNSKMNLTKMYEDYQYVAENILWLNSFIEEYNKYNSRNFKDKEDEIIMSVKLEETKNKYNMYKELHIDKKTGNPTKLVIKDFNQNNTVYIEYNEIETNTVREDILAFKI